MHSDREQSESGRAVNIPNSDHFTQNHVQEIRSKLSGREFMKWEISKGVGGTDGVGKQLIFINTLITRTDIKATNFPFMKISSQYKCSYLRI